MPQLTAEGRRELGRWPSARGSALRGRGDARRPRGGAWIAGAVQPPRARRTRPVVTRRHADDRRHVQQRPQGPGGRAGERPVGAARPDRGLRRGFRPVAEPVRRRAGRRQSLRSGQWRRGGNWWPADLGSASSTGAQNNLRYAVFPGTHRLAIDQGGRVSLYDTGDHLISGVSQAQSGDQTLTFTSQHGLVRLSSLSEVSGAAETSQPASSSATPTAATPPTATDTPRQGSSAPSAAPLRPQRRRCRPGHRPPWQRRHQPPRATSSRCWSGWPACGTRASSRPRSSRPRRPSCCPGSDPPPGICHPGLCPRARFSPASRHRIAGDPALPAPLPTRAPLPAAFLAAPIAHRGRHDRARGIVENSRAAVRAAIAGGFGIEIDLQRSADGEAMVFHDATLSRLTARHGQVASETAETLAGLPSPAPAPTRPFRRSPRSSRSSRAGCRSFWR